MTEFTLESLSAMIDKRLDLVNITVQTVRNAIASHPNDIFGMGTFVISYELELKNIVEELRKKLPDAKMLGDEKDAMIKIVLTHMYLREVQLMRKEKESKKEPTEHFLAAARKCLVALHNIPDTGGVMTDEQEDQHLDAAMDMAQALKRFEEKP